MCDLVYAINLPPAISTSGSTVRINARAAASARLSASVDALTRSVAAHEAAIAATFNAGRATTRSYR